MPVREAFRNLGSQGLAISEPGRGVRVASFRSAETREAIYPASARSYWHSSRRGMFCSDLGNMLYVMPPYCIDGGDLDTVYETLLDALDSVALAR